MADTRARDPRRVAGRKIACVFWYKILEKDQSLQDQIL